MRWGVCRGGCRGVPEEAAGELPAEFAREFEKLAGEFPGEAAEEFPEELAGKFPAELAREFPVHRYRALPLDQCQTTAIPASCPKPWPVWQRYESTPRAVVPIHTAAASSRSGSVTNRRARGGMGAQAPFLQSGAETRMNSRKSIRPSGELIKRTTKRSPAEGPEGSPGSDVRRRQVWVADRGHPPIICGSNLICLSAFFP